MPKIAARCAVVLLTAGLFACQLFGIGASYQLRTAEEHMRKNEYDQAIAAYRAHIDERLQVKNRPEWENPYFYYLLIGDIELGRGNVEQAIAAYSEARKNGIHQSLISDRYRYVASWYEEQGRLNEAVEILKENRDLDPLLIEAVLDRLSKEIIKSGAIATPH